MKKRIFSYLLIALLTTSSVSCSSAEETSTTDTTNAVETPAETEPVYLDELPDDLNLNGMNIHFGCNYEDSTKYDIGNDEMVGEVIQDAVYERNMKVMERLQFTMSSHRSESDWGDWAKEVSTSVLAGDDLYQILIMNNNASLQSNNSFCFLDLSDNPYIDITKPYWWGDAIMELSIDTKEYRYLIGDMMLTDYFGTSLTYFNKDIYTDHFGDPNDMYNLALEGNWTLEKMKQLCEAAYVDVNGDGFENEGDQIGMRFSRYWLETQFLDFSCDYQRITRDENGAPIVDFDMESATYVFETLRDMIHTVPGLGYTDVDDNSSPDIRTQFTDSNVLFKVSTLSLVLDENLRNMEAAYGMIPNPKMNELQENYVSYSSPNYCTIPTTCQDVPSVSAVIEALASEAYISVKDDFYEIALQSKYSPDSISAQCIDLALAGAVCDFTFAYSAPLSYLGHILCGAATGDTSFVSEYAGRRPQAQNSINKYIEDLHALMNE